MPNFQNPLDALQQFINARQLPTVTGGMQYSYPQQAQAPNWLQQVFQDRLRARTRQQQNTPRFQPVLFGGFQPMAPRFNPGALTPAPQNRPRPQTY